MKECEIILPYCPSVNHYKKVGIMRRTKAGKLYQVRFNSETTNAYFKRVWMIIRVNNIPSWGNLPIRMEIDVYPPDKRKRDLDGILKVLLDAMQKGGLYDDDYQIAKLTVTRMEPLKAGQIIVRLYELQPIS